MGYGNKTDPETGNTLDLDKTYKNIIEPAVTNSGYQCIRGDEIQESGIIDKSMYAMLVYAELVIADISTYNPNAIYELGIRHASRPFSTIILKEDESKIPFDLNHNKIFHYSHMGKDIGVDESKRCIKELEILIRNVRKNKDVDSPLFEHLKSLTPNELSEEDYTGMINDIADKQEHVFALSEQAKQERDSGNFVEAAKIFKKAHEKVESEPYFIQQYALCRYKSKDPSRGVALNDALTIINKLNPDDTNDPETLGITGAINKGLWEETEDIEFLERAIDYYKKGFQINSDYYTGENYALCLELKARIESDDREKIYSQMEAEKTRREILRVIDEIFEEDNYENRIDIKWVYATYSHCLLAVGSISDAEKYEKLFLEKIDADWEKDTFYKSKKLISEIKEA
jgi:tetratricopeptide (TPR) repeat protein